MMKHGLILFSVFSAVALRADLVIEQQFANTNGNSHASLKVRGDKMRMDQWDAHSNVFSVIIDMETRDSYTLMPRTKSYRKRSGADIRQLIQSRDRNDEIIQPPARAVDTGRSEKVGDHDAKIFTWSGAEGRIETMWVATNFPNFEIIRKDLARIDEFDATGPHPNAQPALSLLPGMVIKSELTAKGKSFGVVSLLSVREEPLDASLFELPRDYVPWKPSFPAATNTTAAPVK